MCTHVYILYVDTCVHVIWYVRLRTWAGGSVYVYVRGYLWPFTTVGCVCRVAPADVLDGLTMPTTAPARCMHWYALNSTTAARHLGAF